MGEDENGASTRGFLAIGCFEALFGAVEEPDLFDTSSGEGDRGGEDRPGEGDHGGDD